MDFNPSSSCNSILESLKLHLPSFDFDSSSENEEDVIFERQAGLSLELREHILEDSRSNLMEEAELEPGACQNNIEELQGAKLNVETSVDNTNSHEHFPGLSFAKLDQVDLDKVLQNLKENGRCLRQCVPAEPPKICADYDTGKSHSNIMDRLVAFCMSQSAGAAYEPVHARVTENTVWDKSPDRMAATVHIDLLCPEPAIKLPTCSEISSESNAVAKHNPRQETPSAKKPTSTEQPGPRTTQREITCKSMLKVTEMNGNGNEYANKHTDPQDSLQGKEVAELQHQFCPVQSGKREETTNREAKQQSDQQRKKVQQKLKRNQHREIHKELEKLTKSVWESSSCRESRGHGHNNPPSFYHCVCSFLSQTPLSLIAHWLPELRLFLDQQAPAPPIHLPAFCLSSFISATSELKVIDMKLGLSPGFYWQTLETRECVCQSRETMVTPELHTWVAPALGSTAFFLHPLVTHCTLQLILDVASSLSKVMMRPANLVVTVAVLGPHAHSVLQNITGSLDALLARKTDPASAHGLHCRNQHLPVFYSYQQASRPAVHHREEVELHSRCVVLLLRRENILHHSISLPAALVRDFEAQGLLGCIGSRLDDAQSVEPICCFHRVPYSSDMFLSFVRDVWAVPDPSGVVLSRQKCEAEVQQVVILTLCGKDMSQGLSLLHRALTGGSEGDVRRAGFELLTLKWLPALTRVQAQELSPYEVGEPHWRSSLDGLMSYPALACALRGVDALASLRQLLPQDYRGDLSVLMSPTPEVAFRQASVLFVKQR